MRKPSTTAVRGRGKLQGEQLTIGLDLGDRSSFYCVLNGAGEVIVEERVSAQPQGGQFGADIRSHGHLTRTDFLTIWPLIQPPNQQQAGVGIEFTSVLLGNGLMNVAPMRRQAGGGMGILWGDGCRGIGCEVTNRWVARESVQ